jgi:3-isopropylmalate/(R)-2-methylmalate dehydratase large subunit
LRASGPVLFLTKDVERIRWQLSGHEIARPSEEALLDGISTDAIIPSQACYSSTTAAELGQHLLTGISGSPIRPGELAKARFQTIVAGKSFGRGSSREHAQVALRACDIRHVVATTIERIFAENCQNYGIIELQTSTNLDVVDAFLSGLDIDESMLVADAPELQQVIARSGGLLRFAQRRINGELAIPRIGTPTRPMTMAEKIISRHLTPGQRQSEVAACVKPGDYVLAIVDKGYAYELQAHLAIEALRSVFGSHVPAKYGHRFYFFEDHLALLGDDSGVSDRLREIQANLARNVGAQLYARESTTGVEGICHTVMLERHAQPGDLIVGNDSHTCTLGAVGALAVGKGASELASALATGDVPIKVPETIAFHLRGRLSPGVTSKDLMLQILALPRLRQELAGSGRVFEFSGEALESIPFDEQVVLANMAIEGGAFSGIIEPNSNTYDFLQRMRGLPRAAIDRGAVRSDSDAAYAETIEVVLDAVEPMVALPGDPQNGIPLSRVEERPRVNIAYIGSCTGGKLYDLERAARILDGRKVNPSVTLYIQASSQMVARAAQQHHLLEIFRDCGAVFLPPGCGACMNAGPGASKDAAEVTVSDTNRNFAGRMGKGRVYLASPDIVAASAVSGTLCAPSEL